MREYRHFQRIRTRQDRMRRAVVLMLIVIVAGALALIASVAHGQAQTDIGEPVCYVSAPTLPQSRSQSNPINCLQPRVFAPIAARAK